MCMLVSKQQKVAQNQFHAIVSLVSENFLQKEHCSVPRMGEGGEETAPSCPPMWIPMNSSYN